jgi:hypothetical protein
VPEKMVVESTEIDCDPLGETDPIPGKMRPPVVLVLVQERVED